MSKSNTNDLNNEKGNSSRNFRNDSPRSSLNPMNRRNDTNSASTASRDQFYYGPGPSSSLGNSSRNSRESDRMLDDEYPYLEEPTINDRQYRLGTQHSVEDTTVEKRYKNEVFEALKNQFRESCGMDLPEADMNTPNEMRSNSNASTSRFSGSPSSEEMGTNQACSSSSNPVNLNTSRVEQESGSDETFAVNSLPARHKLGIPKNNFKWLPRQSTTNANKIRAANAVEANPLGWQANKTTLKERIAFMFCNDTLADVYFMVGKHEEKQRVPAHKFVLSIGSVVFDAMFNGCLTTDHKPGEIMEIDLPDVEPFAFLTLLRFLYTDEVNIGPESVMTTLYTAKKYAVPAMEITCVEFLKQSLGADNAFMLLSQARLFDEPQLEHLCLELIDRDTYEALNGEGFTEIDHETLCLVLGRDSLRIKESSLFQAVMRWANEACLRKGLDVTVESQREVLGCALHLIRYPLMSLEEFAQTAAQSGLLDDREVVELFLYFSVNPKPNTCFTSRPRCAVAGKELIVSRFQRNEVRWGYTGTADRIKFNVDKKIYIVGFGLFGSIAGTHDYPVTIQITECGTEKVIAHHETTFTSDGSSQTFKVHFREPVEITPSITYTASALLKGADTHYGTKGLRRVTHTSPNGDTVTFQFTYAAGNNNGTSVEDGQIPEIIFFTQLS